MEKKIDYDSLFKSIEEEPLYFFGTEGSTEREEEEEEKARFEFMYAECGILF